MGKHKKDKKKKKKKKYSSESKIRKRSRSSSSSSSSDDSSKHKKKSKKSKKDKLPSIDDLISQKMKETKPKSSSKSETISEEKSKPAMTPMTKEQYDEKQSVIRRVYDEDTGRMRLVKGDGEIIEEIVSASRQKEINKMATRGDGDSFQAQLQKKL